MKASVIIPTKNKIKTLELVLLALNHQIFSPDEFEVIVVDDGSQGNLLKSIKELKLLINIRYLKVERQDQKFRAGTMRNLGAKEAQGEVLIFIDDDVIVQPAFIHEHLKIHEKQKNLTVIGYRYHVANELQKGVAELVKRQEMYLLDTIPFGPDIRQYSYDSYQIKEGLIRMPAPWRFYHSNNISLKKTTFQKIGGFDEGFTGWGDEDLELGYRLYKAKIRFYLNKQAIGYHFDHPIDRKKRYTSILQNKIAFIKKHNNLEVEQYNDEFANQLISQQNIKYLQKQCAKKKNFP
ncbi:glycosyltransferase [bacterium]|nr:glycosyltransferase [bacterium]